jgi:cell division protein FtsW (lipid II flippase)
MARRIAVIFSGSLVLLALMYILGAQSYPMGTGEAVGPGLYPLVVGLFMLAIALAGVWEVVKDPTQGGANVEWPRGVGLWRMLAVFLVTLAWVFLLPYVGDAAVTFLTAAVVLWVQGAKRWLVIGITALGMAVISHVLFVDLLGVPMPQGLLFQ